MKTLALAALLLCGTLVPGVAAAMATHHRGVPLSEILCGFEDSPTLPAVSPPRAEPLVTGAAVSPPPAAPKAPSGHAHCPLPRTLAAHGAQSPCPLMTIPEGCHCLKASPDGAAVEEHSPPPATLAPGAPPLPPSVSFSGAPTPMRRSVVLLSDPRPPSP